jgi:hypothetical protein
MWLMAAKTVVSFVLLGQKPLDRPRVYPVGQISAGQITRMPQQGLLYYEQQLPAGIVLHVRFADSHGRW